MADPLNQVLASFIADLRAIIEKYEAAPILVDLDIEPSIARVGQAASLAIVKAISGSVVAGIPPDGLILDPDTITISGTPTVAGEYEIPLTETNPSARNSPHVSTVRITVLPKAIGPSRVTFGSRAVRFGNSTVRFNGVGAPNDKPRLSLSGPAMIVEGNPSNDRPALTLTGPATLVEGNPATDRPALNLTGPATLTEGN